MPGTAAANSEPLLRPLDPLSPPPPFGPARPARSKHHLHLVSVYPLLSSLPPPTPPGSPLSAAGIDQRDSSLPSSACHLLARRNNHHLLPDTPLSSVQAGFESLSASKANPFAPISPAPASWDGTLSGSVSAGFGQLKQVIAKRWTRSIILPPSAKTAVAQPRIILSPLASLSASSVKFGVLCGLWYSASALSSNTGKLILNRFKFPITLTIVQFGCVAGWSYLLICFRRLQPGRLPSSRNRRPDWFYIFRIRTPNRSTLHSTLVMSLFSLSGHVFSSMAIARVPVSTVHTIKALSPLFTVVAYAGLFRVRYGLNTYLSLLPLTLGVMLACSFDMRANGIGFLLALGSTIIFVSQNIFGKKLLPSSSAKLQRPLLSAVGCHQIDKLNLLLYSSAMAFLLMIPIWAWFDLSWSSGSSSSQQKGGSPSAFDRRRPPAHSGQLAGYFFINGTVHFLQCILAFTILSQTSPVTYSIASLIKRVVVIIMAIVWFQQSVTMLQYFGMFLTFFGLYLYNQSKSEIDRGERKRERQQSLSAGSLLPLNEKDIIELNEDQKEQQ